MIPSKELHELPLPDGGRIATDESNGLGIRVTRLSADSSVQAAVQLDSPTAGFGGGGWVLSPSGDLLVLHYYSGQSEETFVFLNLSNRGLAVIAHPEYQYGEYASYAFSPTEDSMIWHYHAPVGNGGRVGKTMVWKPQMTVLQCVISLHCLAAVQILD